MRGAHGLHERYAAQKREDVLENGGVREHDDCILTFTKRMFDPFKISPEDINVEDIAHSLSMTVRANGHIKHFYSVAQHAIDCTREAAARGCSRRVQLACLLHDASECLYCGHPRPVNTGSRAMRR